MLLSTQPADILVSLADYCKGKAERTFTTRILGLSEIESRNLLDLLLEHVEQSSFQMRWRWSEGDVGLWDNRRVLHYASKDYGLAHRVMRRITIKGDRPSG